MFFFLLFRLMLRGVCVFQACLSVDHFIVVLHTVGFRAGMH